MSQENVEVVRRVYQAINSGLRPGALSDDSLATIFDPDVELQQLGDLAGTAGTFRGYEGLRAAQRELDDAIGDQHWELFEHAARDNLVAFEAKTSIVGRASGAPAEIRVGHLFELRHGRILRWVVYSDPKAALEAVGLRE